MKQKPTIQFDPHDYDYLDALDKDGWHWEFTRRNVNYQKACEELTSLLEKDDRCQRWACAGCTHGMGKKPEEYVPCAFDIVTYIFCKFEILPKRWYDIFFPESSLRYPDIPDNLKPVTSPIDSSKPLKSIIGPQLINHVVRKVGHQTITLDADQIVYLIEDILSPRQVTGKEGRTLFIGLDLDSTREDLKDAFNILLQKYVRSKIGSGDMKRQPQKWKSGLMIWDIRIFKKTCGDVAPILGIAKDTVKKQFVRVCELIYKLPYKEIEHHLKYPEKREEDLQRYCSNCSKKPGCNVWCPGKIAFALRDSTHNQRERTFGDIEILQKYAQENFNPSAYEDELIDAIDKCASLKK